MSDTYLRAWNTIPPKRPGIFKMFLAKITRNLAFSRWRSMNAEKRGGGEMTLVLEELDDCIAAPGCVGDGMDAKELAKAIRAFLNTLPAREQDIFLRRYFYAEPVQRIAFELGFTQGKVKTLLFRARGQLKALLEKEELL